MFPRWLLTLTKWCALGNVIGSGLVVLVWLIVHGLVFPLPTELRRGLDEAGTSLALVVLADAIEKRWATR